MFLISVIAVCTLLINKKSFQRDCVSSFFFTTTFVPGISKTVSQDPVFIMRYSLSSFDLIRALFIGSAKLKAVKTIDRTDKALLRRSLGVSEETGDADLCFNTRFFIDGCDSDERGRDIVKNSIALFKPFDTVVEWEAPGKFPLEFSSDIAYNLIIEKMTAM